MELTPQESLLHWYETNGRHDLPWRLTNDPYPIWISEIMLQQTQVKTVLERFYFPFLEAFPTLESLASANLDDVLKKWEGLGYYTRAKNLHTAARLCRAGLPSNAEGLIKLPGIGRSTAHAIAAFAYRERLPILDANVKRILHRYFAVSERNEKVLWEYAYSLFDPHHPFEYNQAMMDLGSLVCTSKKPLCDVCPLFDSCLGKVAPLTYPLPRSATPKPVRKRWIIIHRRNGKLALAQRQSRFLSGLWGFREISERPNITMTHLGNIVQHYSHFTLNAEVCLSKEEFDDKGFEWFEPHELELLSLSGADHKAAALIRYNLKNQKGKADAEEN